MATEFEVIIKYRKILDDLQDYLLACTTYGIQANTQLLLQHTAERVRQLDDKYLDFDNQQLQTTPEKNFIALSLTEEYKDNG